MQRSSSADQVVDSFTRCASSAVRRDALDALVDALDSYEIRHLQNKLAGMTFTCDIVSRVPLELAVIIFSFLDTDSPYYLRRVCKSWNRRLRSPKILKASLDTWYAPNDPRLWGEDALEGQDLAIWRLKAEHSHRLRNGQPCSSLRVPVPFDHDTAILHDDTIAFIVVHGMRMVNVCNLRTGNAWKLQGDGREQFNRLGLSRQKKSFCLFPGALRCITCDGRTVACGGMSDNAAVVYIWNYDSQKGQSFGIDWNELPFRGCSRLPGVYTLALLLDATAQKITVFTADARIQSNAQPVTESSIQWSVFKFDGERIVDGRQVFSDITSFPVFLGFRPTDNEGRFDFRVKGHISGKRYSESLSFQFDKQSNSFVEIKYAGKSLGWVGSSVVWWKDSFYQVEIMAKGKLAQRQRSVTRFLGTSRTRRDMLLTQLWHPALRSLIESGKEFLDVDAQGLPAPKIFLNEIFMAVFGLCRPVGGSDIEMYGLLELFSFDKDLVLPKAVIQTFTQDSPSSEVPGD